MAKSGTCKKWIGSVVVVGALLSAVGCGNKSQGASSPPSPSVAPDAGATPPPQPQWVG